MEENKLVKWYPCVPACDHPEELRYLDMMGGRKPSRADLEEYVYKIAAGESDWTPQDIIDNYINKGDIFENHDYLIYYITSLDALQIAIEYAMTSLVYLLDNGYDYYAPRIRETYNNLEKTSDELKAVMNAFEKKHGKFL